MSAERRARVADALRDAGLDAVVAALPANVLLLTGYWPVIGTAVAVATAEGQVGVVVPPDERDLTATAWTDVISELPPSRRGDGRSAPELLEAPLRLLLGRLGVGGGRIGIESGPVEMPTSYVGAWLYGDTLRTILERLLRFATTMPAGDVLARLRSRPVPLEQDRIRRAATVVGGAYDDGAQMIAPTMTEAEAAAGFRAGLEPRGLAAGGLRAGGLVSCMAGPESAAAYGSHARSSARRLRRGELLLVHGNSYVDGYWTDVTRTYVLGQPDARQRELYEAVHEARAAALGAIRAGVRAADVDTAARRVMQSRGLGDAFRHATGHGVGLAAINHEAEPRLAQGSPDVLEPGMVCNVEPAAYVDGVGGVRHCDMVLVTDAGAELLTPFHASLESVVVEPAPAHPMEVPG